LNKGSLFSKNPAKEAIHMVQDDSYRDGTSDCEERKGLVALHTSRRRKQGLSVSD
jgi:hypothetical protein